MISSIILKIVIELIDGHLLKKQAVSLNLTLELCKDDRFNCHITD